MIKKLRRIANRLWSLDFLALVLAIMALNATRHTHHRTHERLNEMEDIINQGIHIPIQPRPPILLEPDTE